MSIRFIGAVWDSGLYDGPRLLMMLALADHADDDGWCWPNHDTLAQKIRRNVKTVYRVLTDLEAEGAIRRESNRIGICEPDIIDEVNRRRDTKSRPTVLKNENVILTPENPILNNENSILKTENEFLKTENDILKIETPYNIDPSIDPSMNRQGEPGGGRAPIEPPTFQPVPETLKRQKARRGVVEATPAPPPAALALLHELTGYWPGDDNAPLILASLGDNPDRSTLARAVELWRASGHKINNWLGICDWYDELRRDPAWTPQARFKGKKSNNGPAARQTVSTPEPGSQPVTW